MKYVISPLDAILYIANPTKEQRILQHARRLEIALEQGDTREATRELNLMMRLYHEVYPEVRNPTR